MTTSPSPHDATFEAIAGILVDSFQVDRALVSPEANLESLGLDSLALMEFVFAAEDRFGIRIPEDRLDPRQAGVTLQTLAGLIDAAVAAKADPSAASASASTASPPIAKDDAAAS